MCTIIHPCFVFLVIEVCSVCSVVSEQARYCIIMWTICEDTIYHFLSMVWGETLVNNNRILLKS